MLVLFVSLDTDVGSDVDVDVDVDDNVLFLINCGRKVPFLAFSVLIIGSQVSWSLNSEEILGKESSVWKLQAQS